MAGEARVGRRWVWAGVAFALLAVLGLGARGWTSRRPPIHLNQNMDRQPKYLPQSASGFFYNGSTSQPQVAATLARGDLVEDQVLHTGRSDWSGYSVSIPEAVDAAWLERGEERFRIFCQPCHGASGDGQGMLTTRARIRTADLVHDDRLRQMPAGQLFEIIGDGVGLMPGYGRVIPVADRWAITAWVRQLQSSEAGG